MSKMGQDSLYIYIGAQPVYALDVLLHFKIFIVWQEATGPRPATSKRKRNAGHTQDQGTRTLLLQALLPST